MKKTTERKEAFLLGAFELQEEMRVNFMPCSWYTYVLDAVAMNKVTPCYKGEGGERGWCLVEWMAGKKKYIIKKEEEEERGRLRSYVRGNAANVMDEAP